VWLLIVTYSIPTHWRLQVSSRRAVAAMSIRETSSDLSILRDTAHPFATQSKSGIVTVNGIYGFNSGRSAAGVVGLCRFVIFLASLRIWS
jgi:hypothetical protein